MSISVSCQDLVSRKLANFTPNINKNGFLEDGLFQGESIFSFVFANKSITTLVNFEAFVKCACCINCTRYTLQQVSRIMCQEEEWKFYKVYILYIWYVNKISPCNYRRPDKYQKSICVTFVNAIDCFPSPDSVILISLTSIMESKWKQIHIKQLKNCQTPLTHFGGLYRNIYLSTHYSHQIFHPRISICSDLYNIFSDKFGT